MKIRLVHQINRQDKYTYVVQPDGSDSGAAKRKHSPSKANALPIQLASVSDTESRFKSELYGLLTTICGAGLVTSSWALTFWICAACSLSCALRTSIPICCCATVDFSSAMLACWFSILLCCSSTLLCSLRNSLSIMFHTCS